MIAAGRHPSMSRITRRAVRGAEKSFDSLCNGCCKNARTASASRATIITAWVKPSCMGAMPRLGPATTLLDPVDLDEPGHARVRLVNLLIGHVVAKGTEDDVVDHRHPNFY